MDGRGVHLPYNSLVVWTWDTCKVRGSAARMRLYREVRTGRGAIRLGMRVADFEWDLTRGFCAVRGLHLTFAQTRGSVGTCPWCFESYRVAKRGRVFLCGHQVCFACEFASRRRGDHRGAVGDIRCWCGVPIRYLD